jgi:hypothetical protein
VYGFGRAPSGFGSKAHHAALEGHAVQVTVFFFHHGFCGDVTRFMVEYFSHFACTRSPTSVNNGAPKPKMSRPGLTASTRKDIPYVFSTEVTFFTNLRNAIFNT